MTTVLLRPCARACGLARCSRPGVWTCRAFGRQRNKLAASTVGGQDRDVIDGDPRWWRAIAWADRDAVPLRSGDQGRGAAGASSAVTLAAIAIGAGGNFGVP